MQPSVARNGPIRELDQLNQFVEEHIDDAIRGMVDPYVVHVVASPETYRLAFEMNSSGGYTRRYMVYKMNPQEGLEIDEDAVLFLRDPPDCDGHINSPLTAVHAISSFVDGLVQMAAVAEAGRAQPSLVTQVRKQDKKDGINPQDMFFDGESRDIHNEHTEQDNESAARATQLQLQLCRVLNQANVGATASIGMPGMPGMGQRGGGVSNLPSNTFTLPIDQEVAPHAPVPQTRADLHDLLRISVDFMATAMGVPSSLIFESRFASRSTAQCVEPRSPEPPVPISYPPTLLPSYPPPPKNVPSLSRADCLC